MLGKWDHALLKGAQIERVFQLGYVCCPTNFKSLQTEPAHILSRHFVYYCYVVGARENNMYDMTRELDLNVYLPIDATMDQFEFQSLSYPFESMPFERLLKNWILSCDCQLVFYCYRWLTMIVLLFAWKKAGDLSLSGSLQMNQMRTTVDIDKDSVE